MDAVHSVPILIFLIHLPVIISVVYSTRAAALVVMRFMFFLMFFSETERNQDVVNLLERRRSAGRGASDLGFGDSRASCGVFSESRR
jgi:hypothetical protein